MDRERELARMRARRVWRARVRRRRLIAALAGLVVAGAAAFAAAPGFGGVLGAVRHTRPPVHNRAVAPPSPPHHSAGPGHSARLPRYQHDVYAGTRPGMFSPAVRGVPERVYVPNSDAGTVSVIDPATFRVLRTFPTIAVGASPHGLTFFPQPGAHSLGHNGVYR